MSKRALPDDPNMASIDLGWTPAPPEVRLDLPILLTVAEAAGTLRTTVEALRARLRRAQVRAPDGSTIAPLGAGIVGIKIGANTWRVRFDAK
jgi:hypothetical protein